MRSWSVNRSISIILKSLVIIFLAITVIILSSCDGYINIKGVVYEWVNAPAGAESKIYIVDVNHFDELEPALKDMMEKIPADIEEAPLGGVSIRIADKRVIEKKGEQAYDRGGATTNASGEFSSGWVIAPGQFELSARVKKEGYMDVTGESQHGPAIRHVIVAILVKNEDR